jgi:hypothetical protein
VADTLADLYALIREQQALLTRAMAQLAAVERQRDDAIAVAESLADLARANAEAARHPSLLATMTR